MTAVRDVVLWMRAYEIDVAHFRATDTWGWALPRYQRPRVEALPLAVYNTLQDGAAAVVPGTLLAGTWRHRIRLCNRQWATREAAVAALAATLAALGRLP